MLRFLILCVVLSWPYQIAASYEPGLALPLLALGGIGPTLAATIVTRGAIWRTLRAPPPAGMLVLALLAPLATVTLAAIVDVALGGELLLGVPFYGALLLPPIGEELGWRGYLQPSLARAHGHLAGAVGVGLAWAVWHLVPAVIAGEPALDLAYFGVSIVAWSIVFAWVLERGGGHVWLAVGLHAGINATPLVAAGTTQAALLRLGVLVITAACAARTLSNMSPRRSVCPGRSGPGWSTQEVSKNRFEEPGASSRERRPRPEL